MVVGKTLLVHGGLTVPHLDFYGGIEEMNRIASEWIAHKTQYPTAYTTRQNAQIRATIISKSMPHCLGGGNSGESSPVWVRLYSHPADMEPRNDLAQPMIGKACPYPTKKGEFQRKEIVGCQF